MIVRWKWTSANQLQVLNWPDALFTIAYNCTSKLSTIFIAIKKEIIRSQLCLILCDDSNDFLCYGYFVVQSFKAEPKTLCDDSFDRKITMWLAFLNSDNNMKIVSVCDNQLHIVVIRFYKKKAFCLPVPRLSASSSYFY